jgi:outer membrane immunogenic protein
MAGVALAALVAAPAMAADLGVRPAPAYKEPPMPVASFSWNGCYVGGNIGYGWGKSSTDAGSSVNVIVDEPVADYGSSPNGVVGGGQIGCNYQSGSFVIGLEGEGWWSGMKATTTVVGPGEDALPDVHTLQSKNLWDADLAVRLGIASDRTLFYVKGGGAYGRFQYTFQDAADFHNFDVSTNRFGWIVGGGIEYAFLQNWTAKLEYDYLFFGTNSVSTILTGPSTPYTFNVKESKSIIKAGLNYKF